METNLVFTTSIQNSLIKNKTNLEELDTLADNSHDRIYSGDIIHFIPAPDIVPTLQKIKTKLKYGGILTIEGYDLFEVSLAVTNDKIGSSDVENVISGRRRLLGLEEVRKLLGDAGYKVLSQDIDALRFLVEAQNA